MDEVQAMTHAGETVGRAMGTGLRTLRHRAVIAGHAGVETAARAAAAAERRLAESEQTLTAGTGVTRRRWPWLLALIGIVAAAGTAVILRGRSSTGPAAVHEPAEPDADEQRVSGNGTAPRPRTHQAKQKEFHRKN